MKMFDFRDYSDSWLAILLAVLVLLVMLLA